MKATTKELFGIDDIPLKWEVEEILDSDDYIFDESLFKDFLAWWTASKFGEPLNLIGPTGCGKTSFVQEFAKRIGYSLYTVSCHGDMEVPELLGNYILKDGDTTFQYGPVVRAMREGAILLLDEYDLLNPGTASGLNGVLEGRSIFLPETGERIEPDPGFKVVLTSNTAGSGDLSGNYAGTQVQNKATLDRVWPLQVDYKIENEKSLVAKLTNLPSSHHEKFFDIVETIRGKGEHDGYTFSTRVLLRYANMIVMFAKKEQQGLCPFHYAIDRAWAFSLDNENRAVVHDLLQRILGHDEKLY